MAILSASQLLFGLNKAWYGNYNNQVTEIGGNSVELPYIWETYNTDTDDDTVSYNYSFNRNAYSDYEILNTSNAEYIISDTVSNDVSISDGSTKTTGNIVYYGTTINMADDGTATMNIRRQTMTSTSTSWVLGTFVSSNHNQTVTGDMEVNDKTIYYIPNDAIITGPTLVGSYYRFYADKAYKVSYKPKTYTIRAYIGQNRPKITWYTYTGTGTWGVNNKTTLYLGHGAKWFFFLDTCNRIQRIHGYGSGSGNAGLVYIPRISKRYTSNVFPSNSTNSGYNRTSVSLDNEYINIWEASQYSSSTDPTSYQFNSSGVTYRYGVISY